MTPAENQGIAKLQQTVEAALDVLADGFMPPLLHSATTDPTHPMAKLEFARAALRDLVAQADRVAELKADRDSLRDHIDTLIDDIEAYCDSCDRAGGFPSTATLRKIASIKALAGDGGGA